MRMPRFPVPRNLVSDRYSFTLIAGKLYGAKWHLRMKERNEKRIAGWPKYIRWPLQGAIIAPYYSMNGFKF